MRFTISRPTGVLITGQHTHLSGAAPANTPLPARRALAQGLTCGKDP